MESKEIHVYEFQNPQYMCRHCWALNALTSLQHKHQSIHYIYASIKSFLAKLALWKHQLKANNCLIFHV
jgi:hypothetical protein